LEDDHHQSSKSFLIPTKSPSSSPSNKKNNHRIVPSVQLTTDDSPPAIPPRKPLDKKYSVQISSTTSDTPVLNSSSQAQSMINDDISFPNSRRLSNKEVRRSLLFSYVFIDFNLI